VELSDLEVVALVQRGDTDAYRVLVERHSQSVFKLAFRMTRNESDAEDLVQESFLKAYRSLGRFDGRSSFTTWLYRITANSALDLIRARKPSAEMVERKDPTPSPERSAISVQVRDALRDALDLLTPQERAAFTLRHFSNLSIKEISESLSLNENAAKHSIFRAVKKLREALEPSYQRVS
jgi:RNA polymerase sigma-70 factor (ECF subfamily)